MLDVGVWLDGFEERRAGVLGGWIEAGGSIVGIEIALDGAARFGPLVREAGLPMVSGRYGLGWTTSHIGFETTDGGMTWKSIDVPEPMTPPRAVLSRACGPIGCTAAGWLRIGWGKPRGEPPPPAPPARGVLSDLRLAPARVRRDRPRRRRWRRGERDPVCGAPSPAISHDDRLIVYDAADTLGHAGRFGALARVYAWGPKSGEWDHVAKWQVRWGWPFSGGSDVRAALPGPAPLPGRRRAARRRSQRYLTVPLDDRCRGRPFPRAARGAAKPSSRRDAVRAGGRSSARRDPSRRRGTLRRHRLGHPRRRALVHRDPAAGRRARGGDRLAGRWPQRTRARARSTSSPKFEPDRRPTRLADRRKGARVRRGRTAWGGAIGHYALGRGARPRHGRSRRGRVARRQRSRGPYSAPGVHERRLGLVAGRSGPLADLALCGGGADGGGARRLRPDAARPHARVRRAAGRVSRCSARARHRSFYAGGPQSSSASGPGDSERGGSRAGLAP